MERKEEKKREGFQLEHWHIIAGLLMVYDALSLAFSYFIALWLRFDLRYTTIDYPYLEAWKHFLPLYILFSLAVFWYLKLYKSIWRFASYSELLRGDHYQRALSYRRDYASLYPYADFLLFHRGTLTVCCCSRDSFFLPFYSFDSENTGEAD